MKLNPMAKLNLDILASNCHDNPDRRNHIILNSKRAAQAWRVEFLKDGLRARVDIEDADRGYYRVSVWKNPIHCGSCLDLLECCRCSEEA